MFLEAKMIVLFHVYEIKKSLIFFLSKAHCIGWWNWYHYGGCFVGGVTKLSSLGGSHSTSDSREANIFLNHKSQY